MGSVMQVLNGKEVKKLHEVLHEQFGITENVGAVFLQTSKDKIQISTRSLGDIDMQKLRIDTLGLYFGQWMVDGFRLSIEGSQIVAKKATKNLIELTREQWESWLHGEDMEIEHDDAFVLVMYNGECYGCGKASKGKLLNYVPKARRLNVLNA
ncbi:MAG: hypothetical protein ABIA93_01915 [Candidatus Woesearchaeota archaeon]